MHMRIGELLETINLVEAAGRPWTDEDNETLRDLYSQGIGPAKILG